MVLKDFTAYLLEAYKTPNRKIVRRFIIDNTAIPVKIGHENELLYNLLTKQVDELYKGYRLKYPFEENARIEIMVQTHIKLKMESIYQKVTEDINDLIKSYKAKHPDKSDNLIYKMVIFHFINEIVQLKNALTEFVATRDIIAKNYIEITGDHIPIETTKNLNKIKKAITAISGELNSNKNILKQIVKLAIKQKISTMS